jgi:outer membrane protein OmpA-like peptidoglycan-associated protein
VGAEISQVESRLSAAKAAHLDLISPRSFQKASEKTSEAAEKAQRGDKIQDIQKRLGEAVKELEKAEALQEVGELLLQDALAAWSDALNANAPEFAPEEWKKAKEKMLEAGRKVEDGDQNGARKKAGEATQQLRAAELQAIRKDLLGRARQLREEAIAAQADERARVTFKEAETLLGQADEVLDSNRYSFEEVESLARSSSNEFQHAIRIAGTQKELERNEKIAVEELIREHEQMMARPVEVLGLEFTFAEGMGPVSESLVASLEALLEDRANLQAELQTREGELAQALQTADSLDSRLAVLEDREQALTTEMRRREQFQETLRSVQKLFTSEEALVLQSGDDLVIRLAGIGFPPGSSEIQPQDFSLLTKVQQVIRKFPEAELVVEGHTDSRGDTEYNYLLSRRRADAVMSYLTANMGLPPDRITALGFGEVRPIASNETVQGRAQNRRIDLRIKMKGEGE